MSVWHAVHYRLKPGSEQAVAELLRFDEPIDTDIRDGEGRLVGGVLGSAAVVGPGTVLVAFECEGPLPAAVTHLRSRIHREDVVPVLHPYLADEETALGNDECVLVCAEGDALDGVLAEFAGAGCTLPPG